LKSPVNTNNLGIENSISSTTFINPYRYGFNGKEKDDEVSGAGNEYDYGFRIYNPRLGRFLSVDPLFKGYANLTTYQFSSNNPIKFIDLDGLEATEKKDNSGKTVVKPKRAYEIYEEKNGKVDIFGKEKKNPKKTGVAGKLDKFDIEVPKLNTTKPTEGVAKEDEPKERAIEFDRTTPSGATEDGFKQAFVPKDGTSTGVFEVSFEGGKDLTTGEPAPYTLEIGILNSDGSVKSSTSINVTESGKTEMEYELGEGEQLYMSTKSDPSKMKRGTITITGKTTEPEPPKSEEKEE